MTTKTVLGTSLAAIFAISMIMTPASAHLTYQGITAGSVSVTAVPPNLTKLSLTATGTIPKNTPDLVGFAWLYSSGPNTAFAITSHQSVRDSAQNPDGWHAHNVVLGTGAGAATLCVSAISDAPNSGVAITGSSLTVQARNSILTGTLLTTAAAFDIIVEPACPITSPTASLRLGIIVDALGS